MINKIIQPHILGLKEYEQSSKESKKNKELNLSKNTSLKSNKIKEDNKTLQKENYKYTEEIYTPTTNVNVLKESAEDINLRRTNKNELYDLLDNLENNDILKNADSVSFKKESNLVFEKSGNIKKEDVLSLWEDHLTLLKKFNKTAPKIKKVETVIRVLKSIDALKTQRLPIVQ